MSDDTIITESETYTLVLGTNNLYYDINNQELIGGKIIILNVIERVIEQEVSDTTGDNNEEPINEEPIIPTPTRTLQSISGVVSNNRDNSGTNNNYVVGDTVTITWTKNYNLAPLTETESESYTLVSSDIDNKSFIYTDTEYNSNEIVVVGKSIISTTPSHVWERNGNNAVWITWSLVVTYNNGETFPLTTNKTNYNLASNNIPTYNWTDYNIMDSITFNRYMFDGQYSILYYENVKDMNYEVLIKSKTIYRTDRYECTESIVKNLDNMTISVELKSGSTLIYSTRIDIIVDTDNSITFTNCLDFTYGTTNVSTGAYYFASNIKYRKAKKSDITNFNDLFRNN